VSIDVVSGGDDTLDGGTGNDVIIGGQGNDLLIGSLSEDLVFGSNAAVTLVNGLVTSIFSETQDLVTEALYALFNALPTEDQALLMDFFERLQEQASTLLDPIDQPDPLQDVQLFRKLFALGAQARALLASGEFAALFQSDAISEPETPAHAPMQQSGESEQTPAPQADATVVLLAALDADSVEAVLFALAEAAADAGLPPLTLADAAALLLGLAVLRSVRGSRPIRAAATPQ
ncbi:MAG: hypothetical protein JNM97_21395, partial [Rhodoferax sp.]|nr:hypothetical protein [Rhodoferax sp.]